MEEGGGGNEREIRREPGETGGTKKIERGKEGNRKKQGEREREISSFSQYALRDILVVSSWRVSTLISEILNAPIPRRKSDQDVSLSLFLSLLFTSFSYGSRCSRMHACVHARVRTSSTRDNLGAASSADVSSYSVLKAMTLSPIRAIIHLSWLFSPLALSSFSLLYPPCRPPSSILPLPGERKRWGQRRRRNVQ